MDVVITDWDDTMLATSSMGFNERSDELAASVCAMLNAALGSGAAVYIVTNSDDGWVRISAERHIPSVLPLLDRVCILSAKSMYQKQFPDNPMMWKQCTVSDIMRVSSGVRSVIAFGDLMTDREAVRNALEKMPVKVKTVKLVERPSVEQLHRQLELISGCFERIRAYDGDLDVALRIGVSA